MEYYNPKPIASSNILSDLLTEHPDYLPTYFKAANLFWSLEQFEKAEKIFKEGIKLAKKSGDNKALFELNSAYQNFQFDRYD